MRVVLLHNRKAGRGLDPKGISRVLEEAGHDVTRVRRRKHWLRELDSRTDVVAVAGGDGTVRKAVLDLAGTGIPFAVLPLGTANNIGKTLEVAGDLRAAASAWSRPPRSRPFDLAQVTAPWGGDRLVESLGGGPFASLVALGDTVQDSPALLGRETDRALELLRQFVRGAPLAPWRVEVDGEVVEDRLIGVEVLNVRFSGPNIPLAPEADIGDGLLDVVLLSEADRTAILDYLDGRIRLSIGLLGPMRTLRGQHIRLQVPGRTQLHLDDDAWPSARPIESGADLLVRVLPGAACTLTSPGGGGFRGGDSGPARPH